MLTLRPYQQQIIAETRERMRRARRVLIQLPTGGGKTALASRMLHGAADKGKRVWFLCHRRELVSQVSRAFELDGLKYGLVTADAPMKSYAMAQICSIPTLAKRVHLLPPPDLICWDECHHVASKSWAKLAAMFPRAYHVGLSATPERLDGKGMGAHFDVMVNGPTVSELIEQGYLSPYRLFAPSTVDTSGLHKRAGDYAAGESSELVNRPKITGDAISHYRKHCDGKRAIVFCTSIEHSQAVSRAFNAAGISSLHIDGKTEGTLRDQMIGDFSAGRVRILTNVDLFGEGFDLPALDAVIDLAPTMSLMRVMQRWGRCLRTYPGKPHGTIMDHVGNSDMHGLPDDDRDWELTYDEAHEKKKSEVPPPRTCLKCFAVSPARALRCRNPTCGEPFPVEGREVAQVDGELNEIDEAAKASRRKVQQNPASTLAGLVQVGRDRKYAAPIGWAVNVYTARLKKQGLAGDALQARLIADGIEAFAGEREAERVRKQAEVG